MPSLATGPIPALTCGHCGHGVSRRQRSCGACGAPLTTAAPAEHREVTSPFERVHPASPSRTVAARAIDTLVALLAACAAGILAAAAAHAAGRIGFPWSAAALGAALGLVAATMAHGTVQAKHGRALGGLLTTTRTVDALTGLPVPWATAIARVVRPSNLPPKRLCPGNPGPWQRATGRVTADLSRGRDPLSPSFVSLSSPLAAPDWTDPAAAAAAGSTARAALSDAPPHAVVISFSAANTAHWFIGRCAIGRNPARQPGVMAIAVPDLSRTLSATHLWLERRDGAVYARDLGSASGTMVEAPGQRATALEPHADVRLAVGTTVRMGDHTFRLDSIGKDGA